ncbi:HD domain-containing protein [Evansella caseinilytica]|uniref:HD domain-containing protein n=1 Tax=Evansella caseinilytica TaxID=1503961 RepID=A0A1H3KCL4_9BACI|nr:HD-GYP domain-containing protein [Evansella caseinilytica]SDY49873.1 HD domain-containing protein [Evansella caseinilytica]
METIKINDDAENIIGKVLAEDVISEAGHFLLGKGMTITGWHVNILKNHEVGTVNVVKSEELPLTLQIKSVFKKKEEISDLYFENVKEVKQLFYQAATRKPPSFETFMKPFVPLLETVVRGNNIFLELHHLKGYDEYTFRHSINVGLLAATIGKILRYPTEASLLLGKIGFFHDIGKMKVSQQILNKREALTDKEYEEIKRHTIYGKEILAEIVGPDHIFCVGALYHHERLDGSGYPFEMKGDNIPLIAQIISVADTFDAISSDRVYQEKVAPFQALEELVKEVYKGRLNGNIVFPFVANIIHGYIGKTVVLSDGRSGQLLYIHAEEISRPLVRVEEEFIDMRKQRHLTIIDVSLE